MKWPNLKAGLIEFFFKVNLMAEFLPSFKTCSLFPTLRSSAEQSEIGMLIKYYCNKDKTTTSIAIDKDKRAFLIRNTVLSFGPPGCTKLTGWPPILIATTKMEQNFTAWDFFFVHYYAYFTRKILQTVAKDKQLLQQDLCKVTRTALKKCGRDAFFFGEDGQQKMTKFDKFRLCLPLVDETAHPYRLSTCIQMMFGKNDDNTIQHPPKYFDLDEHVPNLTKAELARLDDSGQEEEDEEEVEYVQDVEPKKLSVIIADRDEEWKHVWYKRKTKIRDLLGTVTATLERSLDHDSDSDSVSEDENGNNIDDGSDDKSESSKDDSEDDDEVSVDINEQLEVMQEELKNVKEKLEDVNEDLKESDKKLNKANNNLNKVNKNLNKVNKQNESYKFAMEVVLDTAKKGMKKLESNYGVEDPEQYSATDEEDNNDQQQVTNNDKNDSNDEYIPETPKNTKRSPARSNSRTETKSAKKTTNSTPRSGASGTKKKRTASPSIDKLESDVEHLCETPKNTKKATVKSISRSETKSQKKTANSTPRSGASGTKKKRMASPSFDKLENDVKHLCETPKKTKKATIQSISRSETKSQKKTANSTPQSSASGIKKTRAASPSIANKTPTPSKKRKNSDRNK